MVNIERPQQVIGVLQKIRFQAYDVRQFILCQAEKRMTEVPEKRKSRRDREEGRFRRLRREGFENRGHPVPHSLIFLQLLRQDKPQHSFRIPCISLH